MSILALLLWGAIASFALSILSGIELALGGEGFFSALAGLSWLATVVIALVAAVQFALEIT